MNTFGPVFYLARTDTRFDSRIRRQYAPRVRGASRCCRPLPRSQPGAISSCASSQRSTAAEARSLSATLPARVRSRRCPADHWPVAQDRPRSMLLAVLLALNPFSRYSNRYAPITRVGKPNHSACRGSAGSKHWQASSGASAARFNHLASCLSNGQIQIIALQIQSIAVLLDVMRLFRLSD